MDLKEFVAQTISQIVNGVIEADSRLSESGAAVNPPNVTTSSQENGPYGFYAGSLERSERKFRPHVQEVEFDVVINASKGTETKGGIGTQVGSIGLGSSGKSENETSSESRVRFSVPLLMPSSKNVIHDDVG